MHGRITRGELSALLFYPSNDQVQDDCGVDGERIAAPSSAEHAVVPPVNRKGCLETGKLTDARHHTRSD